MAARARPLLLLAYAALAHAPPRAEAQGDVGIGAPIDIVTPPTEGAPSEVDLLEVCEGGLKSTGGYPGAYVVDFFQCAGCPPPYNWFQRCPQGVTATGVAYDMATAPAVGPSGVGLLDALTVPDTPGYAWDSARRRAFDPEDPLAYVRTLFGIVASGGGVPVALKGRGATPTT